MDKTKQINEPTDDFKRLWAVKEGEHYYSHTFDMATGKMGELEKSLVTKVEDRGDSVYIKFEDGGSWDMTKEAGSSISLDSGDGTVVFIGTCELSVLKGIEAYADGEYITVKTNEE